MAVPLLDISCFLSGTTEQRSLFIAQLTGSLKEHGFVRVRSQSLSPSIVEALFRFNQEFFALPIASKKKIAYNGALAPSRGYIGLGHESTARKSPYSASLEHAQDLRESIDFGSASDTIFPSVWPDETELPGLRQSVESCYEIFQNISLEIMRALELGLEASSGSFIDRSTPDSSELRFNYYPDANLPDLQTGDARRAWPHTDIGVITLLLQDKVGGLEFEDRQKPGTFVPVSSSEPTELIVNVADTLERWTNGVLKAGLHRVTIPDTIRIQGQGGVAARSSIVFFFKANAAASAGPIPCFVSDQRPASYSEVTALEYLQQVNSKLYTY